MRMGSQFIELLKQGLQVKRCKLCGSRFHGMTFQEWSKMAAELRKRYLKGEISREEMMAGVRE